MAHLINLYGAPGSGKTWLARTLSQRMGALYVPEVAQFFIDALHPELLSDQNFTSGMQMYLTMNALASREGNDNDIVITDSPGPLGWLYCKDPKQMEAVIRLVAQVYSDLVSKEALDQLSGPNRNLFNEPIVPTLPNAFGNLKPVAANMTNFLLVHNDESKKRFSEVGRVHGLWEALGIEKRLTSMLDGELELISVNSMGQQTIFVPNAINYTVTQQGDDLDSLINFIQEENQKFKELEAPEVSKQRSHSSYEY